MSVKPTSEPDIDSDDETDSDDDGLSLPVKFMDEDDESDDDEVIIPKKHSIKKSSSLPNKYVESIIGNRSLTNYIFADTNNYSFKSWKECFPDGKVKLRSLIFNPAWNDFFTIVENKKYFQGMERILSEYLLKKEDTILPHAELVFNAFNVLSPKQVKVIIIGQDPYPGANKINNKMIPQAMGFSFSVPLNYPKPPSLHNIYDNLLTFNHISEIPSGGCLSAWVLQGCFLMNASFTTLFTKKNVHKAIWKDFTDDLLTYFNDKFENLVFVVWGGEAHRLCQNIDPYRHHIITSSHPSPLGFDKTLTGLTYGKVKNFKDRQQVSYPSFKSTDHFGRINNYLKSVKKKEIIWDLVNVY